MAFNLASVSINSGIRAPRVLLYGPHGIGKSTFGANAPNPIFILTEDGLEKIKAPAFPLAKKFSDVMEAIASLYQEDHDYGSVVLDSADWLQNLIEADLVARYDSKDLAYGKDSKLAADYWREVLGGFAALRNDKGMAVILLAHCEIKRFDSPEVEPYDRYRPKLQERSSALVQEWCDAVLFTNYRTLIHKQDVGFNKEVTRGIGTGERLIHTVETPAFVAKNRYALPNSLPLSWEAFATALSA